MSKLLNPWHIQALARADLNARHMPCAAFVYFLFLTLAYFYPASDRHNLSSSHFIPASIGLRQIICCTQSSKI